MPRCLPRTLMPRSSLSATSTMRCSPSPSRPSKRATGKAPQVEKDFRRLLDDKSIDAVTIATPDHWHALLTVLACQAGKDVYVEKPASHNVVEGRRMVEAARKYNRVVQLGTQRRSTPHVQEAIEHVRSGAIGKVSMAKTWCHQKRVNIGHGQRATCPPASTMRCGRGLHPTGRIYSNRLHYNWHWFWHWGTGELGNNGIHGVDVARWGLGVDAPITVSSAGGKFYLRRRSGNARHADRHLGIPQLVPVCEHRIWSDHPTEGGLFGVAFLGDKGTLIVDERAGASNKATVPRATGARKARRSTFRTFSIASRAAQRPNADIEIGHSEHPALPPRQHRPSHRQEADVRRRDGIVSRPRGRRVALARLQQPIRDAVAGLKPGASPRSACVGRSCERRSPCS